MNTTLALLCSEWQQCFLLKTDRRRYDLWFSTVFPPSTGHMAFFFLLPRYFNLVLCLFFLPLFLPLSLSPLISSHTHLPHISVSMPGCWHNTDGTGSGKDVNLRERCLLRVGFFFICQEEKLLVFLFSTITGTNSLKLYKLHVSVGCGVCTV